MIRSLILALSLAAPCALSAQTPDAPASPSTVQSDLRQALTGDWVGLLEYRDYSQPVTSTKREVLPTWLSIAATGPTLTWHYIFDDGPSKTVDETDVVTFDIASSSYSESDNGKPAAIFKVAGYDTLRSGRGQLILTGSGTDNGKPSETRVTLSIRRNLLEILQESRPAGSSDPFAYRHLFRFTRAQAPAVTAAR